VELINKYEGTLKIKLPTWNESSTSTIRYPLLSQLMRPNSIDFTVFFTYI